METKSHHIVVDFWGCQMGMGTITSTLRYLLAEIASASGLSIIHSFVNISEPDLIQGVGLTTEGHIVFRMIPAQNYVSVSLSFSKGDKGKPEDVIDLLFREFKAESFNLLAVDQGLEANSSGIRVVGFRHGDLADQIPIPFPPSSTGEA